VKENDWHVCHLLSYKPLGEKKNLFKGDCFIAEAYLWPAQEINNTMHNTSAIENTKCSFSIAMHCTVCLKYFSFFWKDTFIILDLLSIEYLQYNFFFQYVLSVYKK
jgi:hypothetical protein